MRLRYFHPLLLAGSLLAVSRPTQAQVGASPVAADTAAPPARWLFKGGLSLTHLRYSRTTTTWQLLLPAAIGLEYQLTPRSSLYGQLDADCQLGSAARHRAASRLSTALPTTTLALGGRHYYGHPAGPAPGRVALQGRYLALEAGAAFEQSGPAGRSSAGRRTVLTPSLFLLWGVQSRPRRHLLCDFNAGAGVLAPAHVTGETLLTSHGWDVGLQANVRLYWAR